MKRITVITVLIIWVLAGKSQPPSPPRDLRWILNEWYSDEFEGSALDSIKWFDYNPTWVGRPPAIFLSSQVSLKEGNMQIQNKKLDKDTVVYFPWSNSSATYNIAGGAVLSKRSQASNGYYEVRMKASRIPMSSTFWLMNSGFGGYWEAACPNYTTEIDIVELIGGSKINPTWATNMMSNTHYAKQDCNSEIKSSSVGAGAPIGGNGADAYHVYGAYWKNAKEFYFYIDGKNTHSIKPSASAANSKNLFDRPCWINMTTETYDWDQIPSDADLANNSINTTWYDWVRSYRLVGVEEELKPENLIANGDFETGNIEGWIGWGSNTREVVNNNQHSGNFAIHIVGQGAPEQKVYLRPNTKYTLSCFGKAVKGSISLGIKEDKEVSKYFGSVEFNQTSYSQKSITFTTENNINLKVYFYAETGEEGFADDFVLKETNPPKVETKYVQFPESIRFFEIADKVESADKFSFRVEYQANMDRAIYFQLVGSDGLLIGEGSAFALAGFGNKELVINFPSKPKPGIYTLYSDIRKSGSGIEEVFDTISTKIEITVPTTLSANKLNPVFEIYPSPAKDKIYIKGISRSQKFSITNLTGRTVKNGITNTDNSIQISDLNSGFYFIHFENGPTRKFIIQ